MRSSSCPAVLAAAVALALLALLPSVAAACSCTSIPTFEEAVQESDAIFLGPVLEVRSAPEAWEAVWAVLHVEGWWKGAPPETVEVLTGANEGVCGVRFEPGVRYLVYAFRGGSPWGSDPGAQVLWTHLCWRTHATWPGDPDLVALGPTPVAAGSWGALKRRYR
jgi:hypothetical protein